MKVLVTGAGGPAGMNVVNHSPSTIKLVVCDADPKARERLKSIGKDKLRFYQVPFARDRGFLGAVNKIISSEGIELIIPTVDEELLVFSKNQKKVNARVVVSPPETIDVCNDKYLFYERFKELGISPKYVVTDNRKDLEFFGNERIFMKPRVGRGSRGTRTFENSKEVPDRLINNLNIFCECLPGVPSGWCRRYSVGRSRRLPA